MIKKWAQNNGNIAVKKRARFGSFHLKFKANN